MMAYGASERSVRLLWRYGILEYLLPLQVRQFGSIFLFDLHNLLYTICSGHFKVR